MGGLRGVRMDCARISGVFLRFDCSVRREFGASGEVDRCAGICGSSHFGFVPSGNTSRSVEGLEQGKTKRDRQECLSYSRAKVQKLLRDCRTDIPVCPSLFFLVPSPPRCGSCFHSAQNQNDCCHKCLRTDQLHRMRQILCERCNQNTGKRQISERNPFERPAGRPCTCQFPCDQCNDSLPLRFQPDGALPAPVSAHFCSPGNQCSFPFAILSLHIAHRGFSVLTSSIQQSLCLDGIENAASGNRVRQILLLCDSSASLR